ncbi:MAG: ABC transporter permease [Candidatus Gastranaerophilales bacterium]|nr:ABC transporter permease [Candidatus Gastranaerophilales bacterium]
MKILLALIRKEFYQIIRDPSSILIAFVLPLLLLFIYMYGVNLDTVKIAMGIKNDDMNPEIATLVKSFGHSKYVNSTVYDDPNLMYRDIIRSKLKGAVIIPNDFSMKLSRGQTAQMLIITDGSEVNMANYAQSYPAAIAQQWLMTSKYAHLAQKTLVDTDARYWYNQDINSHYFILPGSIAVTMTLIGMLLTALVIAREWERGTMEALISTKANKFQIVAGKYIPYFMLGMLSMLFSMFMCIVVFQIPFRGSLSVFFGVGGLFLFTCLGIGLLISTNFKDQFLASQAAIAIGFLPALLLSGLVFPINSMPLFFQYLTLILPPRYFIAFIQSEFMAGTVNEIVFINSIFLTVLGVVLFLLVYKKTAMRLD